MHRSFTLNEGMHNVTPLLTSVENGHIYTMLKGQRFYVNNLLIQFDDNIALEIEDNISYWLCGRGPERYYLIDGHFFLPQILKNTYQISLKQPFVIPELISYKFTYPTKYRLYLRGEQSNIV